jgi:aromatic ring-opening dioxygenase catalytic subunit (LigB family)
MIVSRVLLVPTLVTLLLDEHRAHQTPMLDALGSASADLMEASPEVIVALSARWTSSGPFRVDEGRQHRTITDYSGYGVEVRYDCPGHPVLARALAEAGQAAGLRVATAVRGVDSGVAVPLHFLARSRRHPVIPLGLGNNPPEACRAWGAVLRATLEARPERVAFVVGGMLSNNEHEWNLQRAVPESAALDETVLDVLRRGAWGDLHALKPSLVARAQPQADLRHLDVVRGFIGADLPGDVRCYESGPGMGWALVAFDVPQTAGL